MTFPTPEENPIFRGDFASNITAARQFSFDLGVRQYAKQGGRAERDYNCVYRDNNSACHIGALIPDTLYDPQMEGKDANGLWEYYSGNSEESTIDERLAPMFSALGRNFLYEWQACHDSLPPCGSSQSLTEYYIHRCHSFADEFGLSTAVLDECFGNKGA